MVSVVAGDVTVRVDGQLVLEPRAVAMPATFRLGFTGSTGALTDLHLVNNVSITTRT